MKLIRPKCDLGKVKTKCARYLPRQVFEMNILSVLFAVLSLGILQTAAQSQVLVIEGGTLIDGTGGPSQPDSLIIIEGNTIKAISQRGELNIPREAEIIRAQGQFVLPGLIDMHVHYVGHMVELLLAHGITTIYDTSVSVTKTPWMLAQREGVAKGKIRGPRVFFGAWMDGPPTPGRNPGPGQIRGRRYARNEAEARQITKERIAAGGIEGFKLYWNTTTPLVKAIADEAHKAGLLVSAHITPSDARELVEAGVDCLVHSSGICLANIKDPEKRKRFWQETLPQVPTGAFPNYVWVSDPSNEACYLMEPDVFDETIELLISRQVYINPTNVFGWRCVHGRQSDFDQDVLQLCRNPELTYLPDYLCNVLWLGNVDAGCVQLTAEELEKMSQGYDKLKAFLRKFVAAGGKVLPGSDPEYSGVPGIGLHHEMQLLVDAGLSPMDVIVSATRHSAEFIGQEDKLGTIEAGKLADVIIVADDPLADIRNLMRVSKVIQGGKVIDHTYHRDYQNPIPSASSGLVDYDVIVGVGQYVDSIFPDVVIEGSPSFTLTVNGNNFYRNSTVQFNGKRLPTKFVNVMQLKAEIPPDLIKSVGTFPITVTTSTRGGRNQVTQPLFLVVKVK